MDGLKETIRRYAGNKQAASTSVFDTTVLLFKTNLGIIYTAIVALFLAQIFYYIFFHPLRKVPGPFLAKFSKLWITNRYFKSTWHDDILEIHKNYGPVVRIAPNQVSFVDKTALKRLYGHGQGTLKTPWYNTWIQPEFDNVFFLTQDPVLHKVLRSRVSNAYSMTSIIKMEPLIQGLLNKTTAKLRKYAAKNEPVDLSKLISYFTFDVVGEMAFGEELGMVEREEDVDGIIKSIRIGVYLTSNMGYLPLQMWWFNNAGTRYLLRTFGSKEAQGMEIFVKWIERRIEERIKTGLGDRRKDMLQYFIEMKGLGGSPVARKDIKAECMSILGAGADTTSIAILFVLGDLCKHPNVMTKLQKEIDQAYTDLKLGAKGSEAEINYNDAVRLPYLCAAVRESMRLQPSIQYQLPRITPKEGIQIGEYFLPAGVHAGISPKAMNRCEDIFGSDANEYRPERWISNDEKEEADIKEMNRLLTTFGMGGRVCLGQNIALVEVLKVTAQFCRHFNFDFVNKEKPWDTSSQWFTYQSNFLVTLTEREHSKK